MFKIRFAISVENSLSTLTTTYSIDKDENFFTNFLMTVVPFLHTIVRPIGWASFPFYFLSVSATFAWNYLDVFTMMMSMGLSTLFKQLNNELEQTKIEVEIGIISGGKITRAIICKDFCSAMNTF